MGQKAFSKDPTVIIIKQEDMDYVNIVHTMLRTGKKCFTEDYGFLEKLSCNKYTNLVFVINLSQCKNNEFGLSENLREKFKRNLTENAKIHAALIVEQSLEKETKEMYEKHFDNVWIVNMAYKKYL